jgi:hypothetical protein
MRATAIRWNFREYRFLFTVVPFPETVSISVCQFKGSLQENGPDSHATLRAGHTMLTSNRPVEDLGKLLSDVASVSAMHQHLLHHGRVRKYSPRSWRTKTDLPPQEAAG